MNWRDALPTILFPYLKKHRVGLITDMDGTISPIVDEPDKAHITPRSRELLQSLPAVLALVAIVSGRAANDVQNRVGIPDLVYLGNHGLERWENGNVTLMPEVDHYRMALQTVFETLEARLLPDMTIEDKRATLSIHYRQTADPQVVAVQFRPIVETLADEYGLRVFEGRMIFEVRPPVEINKGTAFRSLVTQYRLDAAIYLGDDTTDVDALLVARELRETDQCFAIGIGVQSPDMPDMVGKAADYLASGISDVEGFLAWLLDACNASST